MEPPDPSEELQQRFALLATLPRAVIADLLARATVRREPAGTLILREGDEGDACYLIQSGVVRVVKGDIELARLSTGAVFGELAVLSGERRMASVEVVEPVELIEISRHLLDELSAAHPGVMRALSRFTHERLLDALVATAPFFEPLSPDERKALVARFRPRRFGRGTRIVEQGAPGRGLHLILMGEVEVVHESSEPGGEVRLGVLSAGSYFGEMALLSGQVASATVRTLRTTETVQLGPRDFADVVASHPVLGEILRAEAARRSELNHTLLAGVARQSADRKNFLL